MSNLRSAATSFIARHTGVARPGNNDAEVSRYSDQEVVFQHDFTLGASAEVFPAGRYVVETGEEHRERSGHVARVRTSCVPLVPTCTGMRAIQIKAAELEAALTANTERQEIGAPSENPDRSEAHKPATGMLDSEPVESQLEHYGIQRVPADLFVWQCYRYTNARDAIAAAIRAKRT